MAGRAREAHTYLGDCPACAAALKSKDLLARYETSNDYPRYYAECPRCVAVVHPE